MAGTDMRRDCVTSKARIRVGSKRWICPNFLECQDIPCHWNIPNIPYISVLRELATHNIPLTICCMKPFGFWVYSSKVPHHEGRVGACIGGSVSVDTTGKIGSEDITLVEIDVPGEEPPPQTDQDFAWDDGGPYI